MASTVRRIVLKRFRSIPGETIDLTNLTFIVGRNGAGKSNFADAVAVLSEIATVPLQTVMDRRGGVASVIHKTPVAVEGSAERRQRAGWVGQRVRHPPSVGLAVEFATLDGHPTDARYAFEVRAVRGRLHVIREQCAVAVAGEDGRLWFDRRGEQFATNVSGIEPSLDVSSLALPVIGGNTAFAPVVRALSGMRTYCIQPSVLRELQDPDAGVSLRSDGGNAAGVLAAMHRRAPERVERIAELLAAIVPGTERVRVRRRGNKLSLQFVQAWDEQDQLTFDAFSMSDGTLRALGILASVYQMPPPTLLVIEEPEASLHPGALSLLLDVLRIASKRMQVIATTHSPELLDADWIQDDHLRVVGWQQGATRIMPLGDGARSALRDHLMKAGELLRSNVLNPLPTGPRSMRETLQAAPLFVEELQ